MRIDEWDEDMEGALGFVENCLLNCSRIISEGRRRKEHPHTILKAMESELEEALNAIPD